MKARFIARGKVAVVGFAQSKIYRRAPVSLGALTLGACVRAIEDAGLKKEQIDGLSTGPLLPAASAHTNIDGIDIVTTHYIAENLGIRPRWYNGFQGVGQISSALIQGINAVAVGASDYVLVHRALHNPAPRGGRYHENPMTHASEAAQWTAPYGLWGPPTGIAMPYMQYMKKYGATREEMATLVCQLRKNVVNNPDAYWYGTVPPTVEDYLNARPIADPITILDCDIPVDGAAAFILTTADRARATKHKPVYVAGYAMSQYGYRQSFKTLDDLMEVGTQTGKILWENSGLSPQDIDVPEVYDGFTPLAYWWLECLGFCPVGEAHTFIQGGRIDPKGKFPMISGGGACGNGRIHGIPQAREAYLQLSQRAGERQHKATAGISCQAFPDNGGVVAYTSEPL